MSARPANTSNKPGARVTVPEIVRKKARGERITVLTAYDFTFATLFDKAGIDILLVGDSLGTVMQGHANTLSVSLDELIYHTRCVARGAEHALVVADMPFLSFQVSPEEAVRSAGRCLKEGAAQAVKLEGGLPMAETIRRLVELGIPVMGHVGLMPQSVNAMGGYRVQGRQSPADTGVANAAAVVADAKAVEAAGAFSIVLEGVPAKLATEISKTLTIPTIGIGAGAGCDGQVLVMHDMLGLTVGHRPSFVKEYATLSETVLSAAQRYVLEVKDGSFPGVEHSFVDGGKT